MSAENKYRERLIEGMLSTGLMALAALFTTSKTNKALRQMAYKLKNDPRAQAAIDDFNAAKDRLDRAQKTFCDRYPDDPACKQLRKSGAWQRNKYNQ
jgi:cell fate (sporulation/competence/biofilm development) regulator YlbF (YheA/YmcA/DUF963 family)